MSIFEHIQPFPLRCRVPGCRWAGRFANLELHFYQLHPHQIVVMSPASYFELTFDDLQSRKPFLLSTDTGIYWFAINELEKRPGLLSKGIFSIGASDPTQYHIKLGTFATRVMEILGPFETHEEKTNQYDFCMRLDYIEHLKLAMTPKVVIYFGNFEEDADEYDEMAQLKPKDITENISMEFNYTSFVCSCCVSLKPGEPIYWKESHYLCTQCYQNVINPDHRN